MEEEEDTLELLLVKVTNPLVQPDIETLQALCQQLDKEHDGYQISLRFLAHKIQSPQEREAMLALYVLEEMVKRCTSKFHNEVGKFRFLNELIKVVSPKYMGNKSSSNIKKKIIELMFKWSIELKQEPKIFEAYQMLKRQGVVTEDPVYILENYVPPPPPPPRSKNDLFDDEEKSKLLQRLLQSRNPSDLQAANQLIKSMVHEADKRMEQMARRASELETVHNNAKVLDDMLNNYKPGETSNEEKELMKELYESCKRLRPKLFKLAGEMDEKDKGFDDLLKANDELIAVINHYKEITGIDDADKVNGESATGELSLMDLSSPTQEASLKSHGDSNLLDEELLALGLDDSSIINNSLSVTSQKSNTSRLDLRQIFSSAISSESQNISNSDNVNGLLENTSVKSSLPFATVPSSSSSVPNVTPIVPILPLPKNTFSETQTEETKLASFNSILPKDTSTASLVKNEITSNSCLIKSQDKPSVSASKAFEDLDVLGQSLLKQSLLPNRPAKSEFPCSPRKIPMNKIQKQDLSLPNSPMRSKSKATDDQLLFNSTVLQISKESPSKSPLHDSLSLHSISVSLETIKPGDIPSITLHERNDITVIVHFGKDSPRPDITVMVVSTVSQNQNPVKNFSFHAAVPKNMKIKCQQPSASDFPSYNPIFPPMAITQVVLLSNPNKDKVRFKYKITYTINEEMYTDINEIENLFESR